MSPSAAVLLVLSAPLAAIFAVGPAPQVSLVLQVASAVALLIGGPLALRAQSRNPNANTWRIVTCWGLLGGGLTIAVLLVWAFVQGV
jgi:hypothetical protein